jgi:Protein of unknown function (DUF3175)
LLTQEGRGSGSLVFEAGHALCRLPGMPKPTRRRWSQHVVETSDALDLERGVFSARDPRQIARSLKRSAEASNRRKSDPFRSAMSMLNFYINRAGSKLPQAQRNRLQVAKDELRSLYKRPRAAAARATRATAREAARRR